MPINVTSLSKRRCACACASARSRLFARVYKDRLKRGRKDFGKRKARRNYRDRNPEDKSPEGCIKDNLPFKTRGKRALIWIRGERLFVNVIFFLFWHTAYVKSYRCGFNACRKKIKGKKIREFFYFTSSTRALKFYVERAFCTVSKISNIRFLHE